MGNGVADQTGANDGNFHSLLLVLYVLSCRLRSRNINVLRAVGRTHARQFREKQKQIIGTKCCAMTSYFDDMTIHYVNMTKWRKNGVNETIARAFPGTLHGRAIITAPFALP
jgi:hypothetical protein